MAFLSSSAQEAIDLGRAPAASEDIVVIEAGCRRDSSAQLRRTLLVFHSRAVMPKLLLIRHCEATAQYPDAPLTAAGTKAAEAPGGRLRDLSPDAVYSSPYERARATVRPFAVLAGLPVRLDDRLRERVLSEHELEDWLDHVRRSFAEPNYRAPGGEGLDEAQSRAAAALADIAAAGHRLPVVVSHGNLIAAVLRSMDAAFGFAQWRSLRNPDLFEVELEAGQPVRFVRLDP